MLHQVVPRVTGTIKETAQRARNVGSDAVQVFLLHKLQRAPDQRGVGEFHIRVDE